MEFSSIGAVAYSVASYDGSNIVSPSQYHKQVIRLER